MRSRLFLIILIGIPIILLIGGVVYFFVQNAGDEALDNGDEAPVERLEDESSESDLPNVPEVMINERVTAPVLALDEKSLWFFGADGRLYRKSLVGSQEIEVFEDFSPITDLVHVVWQKNGPDFIVERNVAGHIIYGFYDGDANELVTFPDQLKQPRFLPGGEEIVYKWFGGEKVELKVSDSDGADFRTVSMLFRPDYNIAVSDRKKEAVLFAVDPNNPSGLFLVDLDNGNFVDLNIEALYQGAEFSPDGEYLAVQRLSELSGRNTIDLYVPGTGTSLPLNIEAGITQLAWTSDSAAIIFVTGEGVRSHSLITGRNQLLSEFPPEMRDFQPSQVFVDREARSVYFTDEKTGYLYRIRI